MNDMDRSLGGQGSSGLPDVYRAIARALQSDLEEIYANEDKEIQHYLAQFEQRLSDLRPQVSRSQSPIAAGYSVVDLAWHYLEQFEHQTEMEELKPARQKNSNWPGYQHVRTVLLKDLTEINRVRLCLRSLWGKPAHIYPIDARPDLTLIESEGWKEIEKEIRQLLEEAFYAEDLGEEYTWEDLAGETIARVRSFMLGKAQKGWFAQWGAVRQEIANSRLTADYDDALARTQSARAEALALLCCVRNLSRNEPLRTQFGNTLQQHAERLLEDTAQEILQLRRSLEEERQEWEIKWEQCDRLYFRYITPFRIRGPSVHVQNKLREAWCACMALCPKYGQLDRIRRECGLSEEDCR